VHSRNQYLKVLIEIRQRTPFKWLGIDSDNDNMFIKDQLVRYCQQEELHTYKKAIRVSEVRHRGRACYHQ
jgi:hypothetical protein